MTRKASHEDAKRPWAKFWWKNWLSDLELRSCSLAARGLWMDMLCIASDGDPYGHLTIAGRQVTMERLGKIAGIPTPQAVKLVDELREAGVFSETENGVIYSRRMIRDKAASDSGRDWGRDGGNPTLKGSSVLPDNRETGDVPPLVGGGGLTPPHKLEEKKKEEIEERGKEQSSLRSDVPALSAIGIGRKFKNYADDPEFLEFWSLYPRKDDKADAWKAWRAAVKKASPVDIIGGLREYQFELETRYQKLPAGWLRGERWLGQASTPPLNVVEPTDPKAWLYPDTSPKEFDLEYALDEHGTFRSI